MNYQEFPHSVEYNKWSYKMKIWHRFLSYIYVVISRRQKSTENWAKWLAKSINELQKGQ
jgi:hypothetical protein